MSEAINSVILAANLEEEPSSTPNLNTTNKKLFVSFSDSDRQIQEYLTNPVPYVQRSYKGGAMRGYLKPLENKGLSLLQKSALIGSILGDGHLGGKAKNAVNYNLKFDQSIRHKEYIDLSYSIFSEFVGTGPTVYTRKEDGNQSIWFRTYRSTIFTHYRKMFYPNSVKIVPANIASYLNPVVLAFWYMDDGSASEKYGYKLHTEGFTKKEVQLLQAALGSRFGLKTNLRTDARPSGTLYLIYIPASEAALFRSLVEPYLCNCFKYKLAVVGGGA